MLIWVLAAGSLICLLYFIAIVLYSGIATSLAVIWMFFACWLAVSAGSVRWFERNPEHASLRLPVSMVTLCCAGIVIMLVLQILIFGRVPAVAESGLDYVIVLGAQVKQDRLSSTLTLRLDKAAEYALQNPETMLVLSGGQGEDEPVSEASAMKSYLIRQGVPESQMILEDRSANTAENIAYSRLLIEEHIPRGMTPRIGLLTSNFHLFRAMSIAESQGMTKVSGIAAKSDRILFVHFCFRDALAILKDRLVGNL